MANTTIEDVLKRYEKIPLYMSQDDPEDNGIDYMTCSDAKLFAKEWASLQTPSNEKYYVLYEGKDGRSETVSFIANSLGDCYKQFEAKLGNPAPQIIDIHSTPIPIQTSCVELEKEVERLKGLILRIYNHYYPENLEQFKEKYNL